MPVIKYHNLSVIDEPFKIIISEITLLLIYFREDVEKDAK